MSRIDDELAQAVLESEAARAEDAQMGQVTEPRAAAPRPNRHLGLLMALLVMGGAVLALVFTSFESAAIYSKNVDELLAQKDAMKSRNVRVQGTLVKGTLARRDDPCEYRFWMQNKGKRLEVRYPQCVVPDTFRDVPEMDVEVTAMGKLSDEGHFQASQIMAKCPSKYDMKERAAKGEKAPHGQVAPASAAGVPAPKGR
jgi:cytochrome c-type biogenesis protein CcmE